MEDITTEGPRVVDDKELTDTATEEVTAILEISTTMVEIGIGIAEVA